MVNKIGNYILIVFMLLTTLTAIIAILNKPFLNLVTFYEAISGLAGLTALSYFVVNKRNFLIISGLACLIIIMAAICGGFLANDFHWWQYVLRILLVFISWGMSTI